MIALDTKAGMAGSAMSGTGSPLSGSHPGGSTKLHKATSMRRKTSTSAAAVASTSSSVTAFPSFDPTYGYATTYVTSNPPQEPVALFSRRSEDHGNSHFSKKIKPFVRHVPNRDKKGSIDLNMSKAENEERGAFVSDMPSRESRPNIGNPRAGHSRTVSGTSLHSASSAHSGPHRGISYLHPARQQPITPTPPLLSSATIHPPDERRSSSESDVAAIPALPPPANYRPAMGNSILRSNTSTPPVAGNNASAMSVLSTSVPATSRNSIDSSFRDKITAGLNSRHRSRTNSNAPMDAEEEARTVSALRAEFNAREAAKDEKYRRREEKRDRRRSEAEERKARRRRGNSGATAGSNGSGIAASSLSGGSETATALCSSNIKKMHSSTSGGASSRATKERSNSEKEAARQANRLESVRYDTTTQNHVPTMGRRRGEELNEKQQQRIPRRGKKQGLGSASKATQSFWMTFWFKLKTAMMKVMSKKG